MVRIILTPLAIEDLKRIRRYYKNYPVRAEQLRKHIQEGYKTLHRFPEAGVIMNLIEYSPVIYRSFVIDKEYKMIYSISDNFLFIHSIFDCRQDPLKMFDVLQQE